MLNVLLRKQTLVVILAAGVTAGGAEAAELAPAVAAPTAAPEVAVEVPGELPVASVAAVEEQAFRDWRLACADGVCAAYTRIDAADGTEVLRLELAGTPQVLRFVTPLGLHLPDGLVARAGQGDEWRVPWRTCAQDGMCVADLVVGGEHLAALRRERAGPAGFTLVEGVPVRLGFSLMGFAAAQAALDGVSPDP
jgi:invasion protein IalB